MSDNTRSLPSWLLPAGLFAVVVALVAIALSRGPVSLDPDSPEGTVQEYLQSISDERWDDAVAVIHPEWLGSCDGGDLQPFSDPNFTAKLGMDESMFGGIGSQRFEDTGAGPGLGPAPTETVDVTISHNSGAGIGSSWNEFVVFELVDEDDFWWLAGDPWPYFIWNCREV